MSVLMRLIDAGYLERIVVAIEQIASKPPVVVAMTKPNEESIKDDPKSIDGKRFRHALKSGGYVIEVVDQDDFLLLYEDAQTGNKHRLILG